MSFQNLLPSPSLAANDRQSSEGSQVSFQNQFTTKLKSFIRSQALLHAFMQDYPHLKGVEFVEQILQHFEFTFHVKWNEKERIPSEGRLVIISNHPLGTLDAAALFKLVSEVRSDVKVVVEHGEDQLDSLSSIVLPLKSSPLALDDNPCSAREALLSFLDNEGALIFFPSQDLSRARPGGVTDTKWGHDFFKLALEAKSDVLPVFINATNSAMFYSLSAIYKPLSSLMLVPEMYKKNNKSVEIRVGNLIAHESFSSCGFPVKTQVKLFKKHVYKIGRGKQGIWPTQSQIAHPEPRQDLKQLISSQVRLGETSDGKHIYLYKNEGSCCVLREIGRLREIAFRAVGEGTGQRRDIDQYDASYSQLVLWDECDLEVVGAYRLADAGEIIQQEGVTGLYSSGLFKYHDNILPLLAEGAELGRSFVQPKYWGKRSLDYLWYGIGAYLNQNPHIRYLFGPVSISNDMPKAAKDLLVYFFTLHFGVQHSSLNVNRDQPLAISHHPYKLTEGVVSNLKVNFSGDDYRADFKVLKHILSNMGSSIPTLYKQYCELCEPGGLTFLGFGVDPDFGDCIDGLVMVDTTKIKEKKRRRYIPSECSVEDKA